MGYDNFGLKIGVEGEKEFKNALRDINQTFKVLGSEMNLVSSQFDKNDKSIESLTAKNETLNKSIDTQKDKVSTLEKALSNAATSFGENDKRTQAWQIQLNNANAQLNDMQKELNQNNKSLDGVSKEFNVAEKQADQFGNEVKNTADKADQAGNRFEKLGGVVKGIGISMGIAFAAIGTAAVSAGKALTDMTVGAAEYADEILTMSTVTGMSTDQLQAYKYAAELVDVSMETLTGSMSKQIKSMSNARDGSSKFADAYAKLGISVADSSGQLRNSDTVYWETIDALGKISNETERDALAMQIFGKSAQELNPLIAQGSAGIAELTEEAKRMGVVMGEDSLGALGAFDDSMQRLKGGAEGAKNALGMVLLPQLQLLADDGVNLLGEFTKGLNEAGGDWGKISDVIGNTVGGIVNIIMENLPKFVEVGLDIVTSIGGAIMDNLPTIIEAAVSIATSLLQGLIETLPQLTQGAVQLVMALLNGIVENLPALVEGAIQMVVALATGIAEALPELIPAVIQAIVLMVQTLIDNLPLILDAGLQLITGLAEGILAAIPVLIEALPQIITSLIDFIIKAIPQIIEAGIKLLVSLVEALPEIITAIVEAIPLIIDGVITAVIEAIPLLIDAGIKLLIALVQALPTIIVTIVKAIPQIIGGLIDAIIGNIDKIILAGVQLLVALIENLPQIIIEIVKAIPQIVTGIIEAIGSLVWKLVEAGGNLIKGLWKGISDAGAWLWEKISGFFGGIVDGIKDFFGIHSPSTVFAGFGENMAQGLGLGFGDQMNKVARDMQRAIPTDFEMNATVNGSYNGVDGSRNAIGTQTAPIYVYSEIKLDSKILGHVLTPIVSQDLGFALRGGR